MIYRGLKVAYPSLNRSIQPLSLQIINQFSNNIKPVQLCHSNIKSTPLKNSHYQQKLLIVIFI